MAPAMPSSFNYLGNRIGCVVGVFVSPDTNNRPAQRPQSLVSVGVSRAVGLDLFAPKVRIAFGPRGVFRTAMPETAIDKDGNSGAGKDNIGNSARLRQQLYVQPIAHPFGV
jgi:hypothetical protein